MPTVSLARPASRLVLGDLVLRPQRIEDAPAITDAVRESLPELKGFMSWAHAEQTLDVQFARIRECYADYWRGGDYVFGAFDAASGAFLAAIGLHRRTLNPRGLEVGYWTRSAAAGRGIATRATRMLIVHGFEHLALERIQCGYNAANARSRRVFEKCGFKLEGTFRNFEPPATPEMRRGGYLAGPDCCFGGLVPEDRPGLPWYEGVARQLEVYDWLGARV